MSNVNLRRRTLVTVILLLVIGQAFNASLSISSFEKIFTSSLVSSYQTVAADLQRNIEGAIRFGKPLEKFIGIKKLLVDVKNVIPVIDNITVSDPSGKILHILDEKSIGTTVPSEVLFDFGAEGSSSSFNTVLGDSHHILLPVKNRSNEWQGSIDVIFKTEVVYSKLRDIIKWNLQVLALITFLASIVFAICFSRFFKIESGKPISKVKFYSVMLVVIAVAQIAYSSLNVSFFKNNYIEITTAKVETLSGILQEDIESFLNKGISINKLFKIDQMMSGIINVTPEIESMQILDSEGTVLYLANTEGVINVGTDSTIAQETVDIYSKSSDPRTDGLSLSNLSSSTSAANYTIQMPLHHENDVDGYIHIVLSEDVIGSKINEIILDSITVVLISLLFVVELIIFLLIFINRQIAKDQQGASGSRIIDDSFAIIRPAAFLYLFAMDLTVSFLPLHVEDMYDPSLGLSLDLVMGLPISVEMFFAGIMLICTGFWMDKRGWHEPFLIGVLLSSGGALLSGFAINPVEFIFFRGIVGLGYGMVIMSSQGFVLANTDFTGRAKGISSLIAGIYSGSICGGAVGAMLAERIGYAPVFFVVAGTCLCTLTFTVIFMRERFVKPVQSSVAKVKNNLKVRQLMRFIFDRNVYSLLLLSSIPSSLCMVGFLYYASPIYLDRIGTTQSNIGRALMVYGIFMIYLAPAISRLVDHSSNKKIYIFLSGVFGSIGLLAFYAWDGFIATVFAIFMLGVSSSLGFASQTVFALNLRVTQELGEGQAMGIYRAVERIGQVLGPIVLGIVIVWQGIETGVAVIGAAYLLFTILFFLLATNDGLISQKFQAIWQPHKNTPEKNYGYALIATMSLISMADDQAEPDELTNAKKIISENEVVNKSFSQDEIENIFGVYVDELHEHMKNGVGFFDKAAAILFKNIAIVKEKEWKQNIYNVASTLASQYGNITNERKKTLDRIKLLMCDLELEEGCSKPT